MAEQTPGRTAAAAALARMRSAGLSQSHIAAAIGTRQSTVSNWERGKQTPSPAYTAKLAEYAETIEPSPFEKRLDAIDARLERIEQLLRRRGFS